MGLKNIFGLVSGKGKGSAKKVGKVKIKKTAKKKAKTCEFC